MTKKHARFNLYVGNHYAGRDHIEYDPHGFGVGLIAAAAYYLEREVSLMGVSTRGSIVRHGKVDCMGTSKRVSVAATAEQWEAVKQQWYIDTVGLRN